MLGSHVGRCAERDDGGCESRVRVDRKIRRAAVSQDRSSVLRVRSQLRERSLDANDRRHCLTLGERPRPVSITVLCRQMLRRQSRQSRRRP